MVLIRSIFIPLTDGFFNDFKWTSNLTHKFRLFGWKLTFSPGNEAEIQIISVLFSSLVQLFPIKLSCCILEQNSKYFTSGQRCNWIISIWMCDFLCVKFCGVFLWFHLTAAAMPPPGAGRPEQLPVHAAAPELRLLAAPSCAGSRHLRRCSQHLCFYKPGGGEWSSWSWNVKSESFVL